MSAIADRSVSVRLRANTAQFNRSIRDAAGEVDKLDRKLRDLRDTAVSVRVTLDDDGVTSDLRALRSRLDTWESTSGKVKVRVELDNDLSGELARLRQETASVRAINIPVRVYDQTAMGMLQVLEEIEFFRQIAEQRLRIPITAYDQTAIGMTRSLAEIEFFRQIAEQRLRIPITTQGRGLGGLGGAASSLGGAAGQMQEMGEAGKIALAILAAFPAIATAAAGAVTFAFGAAFTALPVLAWKSSGQVKSAWSGLWSDIKDGIRDLTPGWESEVAGWTDIIRGIGRDWRPLLEDVFEQLRPAVTRFFEDFGQATNALKPAIQDLMDGFTAMLGELGGQMPQILGTLGSALGALGQAMRDNPEMFGKLLIDLAEIIRLIGLLGQAAVGVYPAFSALFALVGDLNDFLQISIVNGATFVDMLSSIGSAVLQITQPVLLFAQGLGLLDGLLGNTGQSATEVSVGLGAAASKLVEAAGNVNQYGTAMNEAASATDALNSSLDELMNESLSRFSAATKWGQAIDGLTESIAKNGRTLDEHSDAGQANREALEKLAKAARDKIKTFDDGTRTDAQVVKHTQEIRNEFIRLAKQAGASDATIADLIKGLDAIPGKKKIDFEANTSPAMAEALALQKEINAMKARIIIETVPQSNFGFGPGGKGSANADGGYYPTVRAFANGSERHVAQIAPAGAWRLWAEPETGGEAYIPLAPNKRGRSTAILGKVANEFGMVLSKPSSVKAFAAGGITGTDLQLSSLMGNWRGVVKPSTAEDLKDAQETRADRQEGLKESIESLAEARKARAEEIKDARERLKEAQRDRREAAADRKRSIKEAKERLKEARQQRKDGLKDARQNVADARKDLAEARKAKAKDKKNKDNSQVKAAERRLRDAQQALKREERPSSQVRSAERALADAQQDRGLTDATRRVTEAQERLKEARTVGGMKEIAAAEKRIRDARVDLAEATERLLDVEDRRKFDMMRPSDQLSAALAMGISNTGQFIANLNTLADRGFGNLAQQLLAMGGAEAEKMAADAVTLNNGQLGHLQGQIDTRQQQQTQLAMMPESLPVRAAIRSGKGGSWTGLLEATGLDPGTLSKVLKAMPDVAGHSLLADMAAHGYARGGWVSGPGGIDNVPAMLTNKEFVVNARQAPKYGSLLEAINSGGYPAPKRYAAGGWVGGARGGDGASMGGQPVSIEQHFHELPFSPSQMAREAARETAWALH